MSDDIIIGGAKQVAGGLERAAGAALGDTTTELRGAVRELGGAAQQKFGEVKSDARSMASESPAGVFLAGVSVGLLVGLFISRR